MHFTTLYLMKNETLDNVHSSSIEEDFYERFCYGCGENRPRYQYWCDWFQIGGRWCDLLNATKGIIGERSWCNKEEKSEEKQYSIAEIKDLIATIDKEMIYAIATKSRIYSSEDEKFKTLLDKINKKQIKGVVALIDCHD